MSTENKPVAWGVLDRNPECEGWVFIADSRDLAYDHIKDAACADSSELAVAARTWVVRPLYAHPEPSEPYSLPDDLYDSKDWRAGNYAERVAWLHAMYEAVKRERDALLHPTAPSEPSEAVELLSRALDTMRPCGLRDEIDALLAAMAEGAK